ncbi:F-box protein FBXO1 [Plasmodium brasilianum]|uniref:F-box protein FBXO1 n=1 Tax=Plasmodium brasilianum TaxID=5824 RepID=A0ACB9Y6C7_PLABR|nr:F-box protein FBXO1 [Plasmodium brasilianum]
MGNKIPENKKRQFILYKDIKNRIKKKNHIDIKSNIYICKLNEKDLQNFNNEIFDTYNTYEENQEQYITSDQEEKEGTEIKINLKKTKDNEEFYKCTHIKGKNSFIKGISNRKEKEIGKEKDKREDLWYIKKKDYDKEKNTNYFELDYGCFYNLEEKTKTPQKSYSKFVKIKKKKSLTMLTQLQNGQNLKQKNREKKEGGEEEEEEEDEQMVTNNAVVNEKAKFSSLKIKNNLTDDNYKTSTRRNEKGLFQSIGTGNVHPTNNSRVDDKEETLRSSFKSMEIKLLPGDTYTMHKKCSSVHKKNNASKCNSNSNSIIGSNSIVSCNSITTSNHIRDSCSSINSERTNGQKSIFREKHQTGALIFSKKFFNLFKEKKILQNVLSFLNCTDLLEFQKTCSIIYIYVSDFLDYICLNIYSNFKRAYGLYFIPFNFFYKYEYLYTDKPSFRMDCILIAKIEKGCIGYNNRFGYKYKYIYDKKKSNYYVYFNFNVLKSNSSKTIEIHKDISYNNGDDINVSHIINNDVCSNDYICIPINLYNFIGIVDFNSISFISNKLSKYLSYNNHLDDQLWYNSDEYKILIKENNLISAQCFLPHLKHIKTIYSGIDVTVMKSTYKAVEPGKMGKRSYILWGNYFIIEKKFDPVFTFLKREGLQHDYVYHNFYLRVGDSIIFYLIKGGNNDI